MESNPGIFIESSSRARKPSICWCPLFLVLLLRPGTALSSSVGTITLPVASPDCGQRILLGPSFVLVPVLLMRSPTEPAEPFRWSSRRLGRSSPRASAGQEPSEPWLRKELGPGWPSHTHTHTYTHTQKRTKVNQAGLKLDLCFVRAVVLLTAKRSGERADFQL